MALGFPTAGLRKGMAAEVPETGLSLPSCPESMEWLVEQKGTQGSRQLLVSQWQRNKSRRGRERGVEEELPTWPRKQGVAGQLHACRSGQEPGLSLLPSWELSLQPLKFKVKGGSQSSQRQASLTSPVSFHLSLAQALVSGLNLCRKTPKRP